MNPYDIDLDGLYEGGNKTLTWHGRTCWKNPCDLIIYAEIVHDVKPRLVLETGTHMGGSALFWADMLELAGDDGTEGATVVTVDVVAHGPLIDDPRILELHGSSTSDSVLGTMRSGANAAAVAGWPVLVNIDSDHNPRHVRAELEAYAPFVTPGSYMIVEDGVDDFRWRREGPHAATIDFLETHPEFEIDKSRERLGLTNCPDGFLRRL